MKIKRIIGRQILDSRGTPTVEAEVWLDNDVFGRAAVPSGASTGTHEAHELRDGGPAFDGQGVLKAIEFIETEIADYLSGIAADDQNLIDKKMIELDGTNNKSRLGANAILAVSLACAHAAAKARGVLLYSHVNDIAHGPPQSLPMPMMNVLNGGKHATNSADFQEFMIIPSCASSYEHAVRVGAEIFHSLKEQITLEGGSSAVGDEGGFTFPVGSNTEMLDFLSKAVEAAGYSPGVDVHYALDVAASEFYNKGSYNLACEQRQLDAPQMMEYLRHISNDYPVISIEDGLDQDAWTYWQSLNNKLSGVQLVGDDLLVTNQERLQKAIDKNAGNAILIKPNQIGTLTETLQAIKLAQDNNWRTIVSHRSGETEDVSIAHIAIGTGAGQIKTGSLSRSERNSKHNELMRLEEIDSSLQLAHPLKDL